MATATPKPPRSLAEIEDIILQKVLLITLTPTADPHILYLEQTAAELLSESKSLSLCRDILERVIIDRLSLSSSSPSRIEPPFVYLVNSYRRCNDELKKISNMKDKSVKSQLEASIKQAKKLLVSYSRIHLSNPDLFPDPSLTNVSPLLPLIFAAVDGFNSGGTQPPPPGFLEELFRDGDADSLDPIFKGLYEDLRGNVIKVSVLGNFQQPLRALLFFS